MTRLLIFLDAGPDRWLRSDAAAIVARGDDLATLPAGEDADIIAIVPGDAVLLHWVPLPPLAPNQAATAARLLAADIVAEPIEATHVAVGAAGDDGQRVLALINADRMAGWLARLTAHGLAAARIVPLPLLLPLPHQVSQILPADAAVTLLHGGDMVNVRGPNLAFAAEAETAALILGSRAAVTIDLPAFEAHLAATGAAAPIDLRQGRFARRREWRVPPARLRRLAVLAGALAVLGLANGAATVVQSAAAARAAEDRLAQTAASVLPPGTLVTDPRQQVAARLASLGGGPGVAALATALLTALRDSPATTLRSLRHVSGGGLSVMLDVAAPADAVLLAQALTAAGLIVTTRDAGRDGGRYRIDLTLQAQP